MIETTDLQAAVFRRLLQHLNEARGDVANEDLTRLAGFCRNSLADWYREAAVERGLDLTEDEAREAIYGMPFATWQAQHAKQRGAKVHAAH